jgi:hypothetical protein
MRSPRIAGVNAAPPKAVNTIACSPSDATASAICVKRLDSVLPHPHPALRFTMAHPVNAVRNGVKEVVNLCLENRSAKQKVREA